MEERSWYEPKWVFWVRVDSFFLFPLSFPFFSFFSLGRRKRLFSPFFSSWKFRQKRVLEQKLRFSLSWELIQPWRWGWSFFFFFFKIDFLSFPSFFFSLLPTFSSREPKLSTRNGKKEKTCTLRSIFKGWKTVFSFSRESCHLCLKKRKKERKERKKERKKEKKLSLRTGKEGKRKQKLFSSLTLYALPLQLSSLSTREVFFLVVFSLSGKVSLDSLTEFFFVFLDLSSKSLSKSHFWCPFGNPWRLMKVNLMEDLKKDEKLMIRNEKIAEIFK